MGSGDVYVDGIDAQTYLREAVARNRGGTLNREDMFWSTSAKISSDAVREIFQVEFAGARPVNHVSFKAARFPHSLRAEYWEPATQEWRPLRQQIGKITDIDPAYDIAAQRAKWEGEPVYYEINDSKPRVISDATGKVITATHPQHYGTGHWVQVKWRVVPVTAKAIRVILVRHDRGQAPVGPTGQFIAYSLAIKDFTSGFRVYSKADIPPSGRVTHEEFGSSLDLMGTPVTYRLREYAPDHVMTGVAGQFWKSEPQPVNYAVVNFYADVREPNGAPQTIDRFYIDPLTVGPNLNLYYTNDEPDAEFAADDSQLAFPIASVHGDALRNESDPLGNWADRIVFSDEGSSYVDIDNAFLQWDHERPWWLGMAISTSAVNGVHPLASFGGNTLRINQRHIEFVTDDGFNLSVPIPDTVIGGGNMVADPGFEDGDLRAMRSAYHATTIAWTSPDQDGAAFAQRILAGDLGVTKNGHFGTSAEFAEGYHPIQPGQDYRLEVWARGHATTRWRFAMGVRHEDGSLSYISASPWYQPSSTQVHQAVTWTAPDTAVEAVMRVQRSASGSNGATDDATDWVQFELPEMRSLAVSHSDINLTAVWTPFEKESDVFEPGTISLVVGSPLSQTPAMGSLRVLTTSLGDRPEVFSVGRYRNASTPGTPAFALRALALKIDEIPQRGVLDGFVSDPDLFVLKPEFSQAPDLTRNAMLRMHPKFATPANVSGSVGGPGDRYDDATWTPISRDYTLRQGFLRIPPTRAKHFKFEFTNLVHETYEALIPIRREVRVFPTSVVAEYNMQTIDPVSKIHRDDQGEYSTEHTARHDYSNSPGVRTLLENSDLARYSDALRVLNQHYEVGAEGYSSRTEAYVARDPNTQDKLAELGWIWSYTPWHMGSTAPKWSLTQKHSYEKITVDHETKTAFFVGIRRLDAYRVDYMTDDDTDIYYEHFLDNSNISSLQGMEFTENGIRANGSGATVTSKSFPSRRKVRGVQFATIQSDNIAVLEDDGFIDPDLTNHWQIYGDATITRVPGQGVRVSRGWYHRTYGQVEREYETYKNLNKLTYSEIEGGTAYGVAGGGMESERVAPSQAGRIYAAARVSAPGPMKGPVRLEIVSVDTGNVLASDERQMSTGETVVLRAAYGVGTAELPVTYGDLEAGTYGDLEGQRYGDIQTSPIEGEVFVRLWQTNPSQDEFLVQRLSLFDAPISWQFSVDGGAFWSDSLDIRNNPEGVLTFPEHGDRLRWRATVFHPDAEISAMVMRPWYGGLLGSVTRSATDFVGPNRSVIDDYPDVDHDPLWQQSYDPIPGWWYSRDVASIYGQPPNWISEGEVITPDRGEFAPSLVGTDVPVESGGQVWVQSVPPPKGTTYQWTGTPHDSTSQKEQE